MPELETQVILTIVLGYLTIISTWINNRTIRLAILLLFVVSALYAEAIRIGALPPIVLLAFVSFRRKEITINKYETLLLLVFSLAMGFHALPGFKNILVYNAFAKPNSTLFMHHFNIDKILAAYFLSIYISPLIKYGKNITAYANAVAPIVITVAVLISLSAMTGYIKYQPLINETALYFIVFNTAVVYAEEIFFRGFLFNIIKSGISQKPYSITAALALSSLLFGMAHFGGGITYIVLAAIAGMGYGIAYIRTQSIEYAILCHLLVNVVHFTLFTYPQAA